MREKDYSENPQTLGQHLKKRRRELGLLQREVASRKGICVEAYCHWEKGRSEPVTAQFRPVLDFLGYNPSPMPTTIAERLQDKRRTLGATFVQVADISVGTEAASPDI